MFDKCLAPWHSDTVTLQIESQVESLNEKIDIKEFLTLRYLFSLRASNHDISRIWTTSYHLSCIGAQRHPGGINFNWHNIWNQPRYFLLLLWMIRQITPEIYLTFYGLKTLKTPQIVRQRGKNLRRILRSLLFSVIFDIYPVWPGWLSARIDRQTDSCLLCITLVIYPVWAGWERQTDSCTL